MLEVIFFLVGFIGVFGFCMIREYLRAKEDARSLAKIFVEAMQENAKTEKDGGKG